MKEAMEDNVVKAELEDVTKILNKILNDPHVIGHDDALTIQSKLGRRMKPFSISLGILVSISYRPRPRPR